MTALHIDFETHSIVDLPAAGLDNYSKHPTTDINCLGFALGADPVGLWHPRSRKSLAPVLQHVAEGKPVVAHNAAFELGIWNDIGVRRYGWPTLRAEQCRCTMAMAYAMALPGSLARAAAAVGLPQRKDVAGGRIMRQLAAPTSGPSADCPHCSGTGLFFGDPCGCVEFWTPETAPEKFDHLYRYCVQDVEVERALDDRLLQLSPTEQALWQLDYKINQRGVMVDLASIERAMQTVEKEKLRLNAAMLAATGGVVGSVTEVQLLVKWIRLQGVEIDGGNKASVIDALKLDDLPATVRAALLLRQEGGKSSTAKLGAMKDRASTDGRVRGTKQYHGASTGRWAGRGMQTDNYPRPIILFDTAKQADAIAHIGDGDYLDNMYGPPMTVIADSLRGMIIAAPGKKLIAVDYAAIEARMLAWLAGEEKVLEIFRSHGKIYEAAASAIFNVPIEEVTKAQRQIGKVAVLALGYGGGVGAFQAMAAVYGVKISDEEANDIKLAWRAVHKRIVAYWYDLEEAAYRAVKFGWREFAGPGSRQVTFMKKGSFLWCQLPSKRVLCYPYPEIREVKTPWGDFKDAVTYMTEVDPAKRKKGKTLDDPMSSGSWRRISTYGGMWAENITQAASRDLLSEAMPRLEDAGYPLVMHVHDEGVAEVDDTPDKTAEEMERLMSIVPAWAPGLPIAAEGWEGKRYRK